MYYSNRPEIVEGQFDVKTAELPDCTKEAKTNNKQESPPA